MKRTLDRSGLNRRLGWAACGLAGLSLVAAIVSGAEARAVGGGVQVESAWVRPALVAGRPAAGYLTLRGGARADTLVGVSSPATTRVELHATTMARGVMRMSGEGTITVPANARVAFAPGGRHLMLFDLAPGTASVPLTLRFASGRRVNVDAPRRSAVADAMAGMDHRP